MANGVFYRHYAADPYFNMAFDEWMYAQVVTHPGSLLLRAYTWRTGTITFGYNQRQETALDFDRLGETPVIRRVTGGRAVYHDRSELTYAIALNPHGPGFESLAGSVAVTSRRYADALAHFLEGVGLEAQVVARSSSENARPEVFHKAPCFASAARNELKAAGRKVVASAQKQQGGILLQHGSIKLDGLVSHPALPVAATVHSGASPALDQRRFAVLADLFRTRLGEALGVVFVEQTASEGSFADHTARVKKNALVRRDPIKQS
ncbi:MAG: hypothetical protein KKA42_14955 [candidate division Zixibacteria bacterium]|nr:hypothetical protein [candidate division Zixibacteria bacterium]